MNRLMFGFSWELVTVSYFRNELYKVLNLTLILIVVKHLRNGTRYLNLATIQDNPNDNFP